MDVATSVTILMFRRCDSEGATNREPEHCTFKCYHVAIYKQCWAVHKNSVSQMTRYFVSKAVPYLNVARKKSFDIIDVTLFSHYSAAWPEMLCHIITKLRLQSHTLK